MIRTRLYMLSLINTKIMKRMIEKCWQKICLL